MAKLNFSRKNFKHFLEKKIYLPHSYFGIPKVSSNHFIRAECLTYMQECGQMQGMVRMAPQRDDRTLEVSRVGKCQLRIRLR